MNLKYLHMSSGAPFPSKAPASQLMKDKHIANALKIGVVIFNIHPPGFIMSLFTAKENVELLKLNPPVIFCQTLETSKNVALI